MLKLKVIWFLFNLKASLAGYHKEIHQLGFLKGKKYLKIERIGTLPSVLNESSGLLYRSSDSTLLSHNDSGGASSLYRIDLSGKLLSTYPIEQATNVDWEDLSQDEKGNVYIADIGNNAHHNRALWVYQVMGDLEKVLMKIPVLYPQKQVVPDAEAMFVANDSLYIFTKNWHQSGTDLYVRKISAHTDTLQHKAHIQLRTPVTGAAISPKKNKFVLISYGKIYYFRIIERQIDFSNPLYCIKFPHKQTESIAFLDENVVIITNEQGEMYRVCEN